MLTKVAMNEVERVSEAGASLKKFSNFTNKPLPHRTAVPHVALETAKSMDKYCKGICSTSVPVLDGVESMTTSVPVLDGVETMTPFVPFMKETGNELVEFLCDMKEGDYIDILSVLEDISLNVVDNLEENVGQNFLNMNRFIHTHKREAETPLSPEEMNERAFSLALVGYKNTANTLAFIIYLLTKNKDKEGGLLKEIDRFDNSFWGRVNSCNDRISKDELEEYHYADAVVKEALRMFGHFGNQNVPHSDQFIPERYLRSSSMYGMGVPVDSNFALNEAKHALILLYRRFTFSLASSKSDKGVKVIVHHRK